MGNLTIYDSVRSVPKEAQKTIKGGRINGMTDINPMWRLKRLTETFGIVGFGWKYEIVRMWIEKGGNNEESAFVQINLFVKHDGQWSEAIPGIGGSSFVANESKGLYTSDECYKMALTDAISVSCKSLGMGADIYFAADRTKYDNGANQQPQQKQQETPKKKEIPPETPSEIIFEMIEKAESPEAVTDIWKLYPQYKWYEPYKAAITAKGNSFKHPQAI